MSTLVTSAADDLAQSATVFNSARRRISLSIYGSAAVFGSSEPRVGLANKNLASH